MGAAVQTEAVQTTLSTMTNFSSSLWPIRYKPLPDELLSCWLVRLAHGHGMKVQTFCSVIFGDHRQVWNRDIDRLAPPWILDELCRRTGTSMPAVLRTTLRSYEGILYRKFRHAGPLHWILVLQMYHRKRNGFGQQFCPACLAADTVPYFRKRWRVALNTTCSEHKIMLLERCHACGAAICVHRLDMQKPEFDMDSALSYCYICAADLRTAPKIEAVSYNKGATELLLEASLALAENQGPGTVWNLDLYSVMHQLCRVMTGRYEHLSLRTFVLENLGSRDIALTEGHVSFEMRTIEQRHHLLQLGAWILADLQPRLAAAWRARAIRYNLLLKDFPDRPNWYLDIVGKFSNWRDQRGCQNESSM